jgi:hypothetical protein
MAIVAILERGDRGAYLFDVGEDAAMAFFRPADQRFTSATAPGSPPVALRASSSEPGATPLPSVFFNISSSAF